MKKYRITFPCFRSCLVGQFTSEDVKVVCDITWYADFSVNGIEFRVVGFLDEDKKISPDGNAIIRPEDKYLDELGEIPATKLEIIDY